MSQKYSEQYKRMKRWYHRFEEINNGKKDSLSSDYYRDDVYAFFTTCYHLKDWLVKSRTIAEAKAENFINHSVNMKICADLCNGCKHLILKKSRTRTGDTNTAIGASHYKMNTFERVIKVQYEVNSNGKTYDAFDLAKRCVQEWDKFLKKQGLRV